MARYLALAIDLETENAMLKIDIGADRPVSVNEMAEIMSGMLGRSVKASVPPWPLVSTGLSIAGLFKPWLHDMKQMMAYFQRGGYSAATAPLWRNSVCRDRYPAVSC